MPKITVQKRMNRTCVTSMRWELNIGATIRCLQATVPTTAYFSIWLVQEMLLFYRKAIRCIMHPLLSTMFGALHNGLDFPLNFFTSKADQLLMIMSIQTNSLTFPALT